MQKGAPRPALAAEGDLLAVLIEMPELVGQLDAEVLKSAEVARLVGFLRDAVTQGRAGRAEVARHVFSAIAEEPGLCSVLARAIKRADEIRDPAAFFEMLTNDRRRASAKTSARGLRQQLQAALAAGDRETADRLTQELVAQMRAHSPRASAE